jgi:gamma-glutamyl-gamma-aminobutyrate hydrolase PuuD
MNIGITARFETSHHGELWFVFEQRLLHSIRSYLPKSSINLITPDNIPIIEDLNLAIFSGGSTPGNDLSRDSFEKSIYDKGSELGVPMLGICRGAQLFAHFSGVDLTKVESHVGKIRETNGHESLGTCYHNWAIPSLPSEWCVLSRDSQDGTIELFEHHERPILGVLAHPERSINARTNIRELFTLLGL